MSSPPGDSVTALLAAARDGDASALDRVYALVYEELRRLARSVRLGQPNSSLTTTALVHETYLKLVPSRTPLAGPPPFLWCRCAGRCVRSSWTRPSGGRRRSAEAALQ